MLRTTTLIAATFLLFTLPPAFGEDSGSSATPASVTSIGDARQLVEMPQQVRKVMREDMLQHLAALNELIARLSTNNLDAAAQIAENRLGKSSMGKHRGTGMGPGRFMPPEMRKLGWGMHQAASELAEVARKGDFQGSLAALQKVSGACVSCHYSFRTR